MLAMIEETRIKINECESNLKRTDLTEVERCKLFVRLFQLKALLDLYVSVQSKYSKC